MTVINILIENKARYGYAKEHGLSLAITHNGSNFLFDVGASDNFLINASKMNLDISKYKDVVLSHAHWDHTTGLKYLDNKRIITHLGTFEKTFSKRTDKYIGTPIDIFEAQKTYQLELTKKPYQFTDGVFFLGEIPRVNDFESHKAFFYDKDNEDDFVINDSAIAIRKKEGIIVVTGCSHAGIVNIINYAKKICNTDKIYAIIGGLHLATLDEVSKTTVELLSSEDECVIYPMHCTSDKVVEYMQEVIGYDRVIRKIAGDGINF